MSTIASLSAISSEVGAFPGAVLNKAVVLDDRRVAPRALRALAADLVDLRCDKVLCCEAHNVSEGGLFVSTPKDSGLKVGQRFEVRLHDKSGPRERCLVEGCYATVIRTEVIQNETGDKLGAGIRFDQPVFW